MPQVNTQMHQLDALHEKTKLVFTKCCMESDDKPRTIRFPEWLWAELDREADTCRRSAVKQLEVILTAYYRGQAAPSVNLDQIVKLRKDNAIPSTILKLGTSAQKRKTG